MNAAKRDYSVDRRLLPMSGMALLIGAVSTAAAVVLLDLIRLCTNLFYYQTLSLAERAPAGHALGLWAIVAPVVDGPDSMRLIGVVSLRDLLANSHVLLHEETVRERLR